MHARMSAAPPPVLELWAWLRRVWKSHGRSFAALPNERTEMLLVRCRRVKTIVGLWRNNEALFPQIFRPEQLFGQGGGRVGSWLAYGPLQPALLRATFQHMPCT